MPAPLDPQRRAWTEAARAKIDPRRLTDLIAGMVDIPSPTGEEGPLARWLAERLGEAGLEARYQPIDDGQGNAVGRLRGDGTGPDLLLYAPIDTLTVGTEEEDVPQAGPGLRDDMRPSAAVNGDFVIGLGASNPKGHGAALIAAAEAVAAAGIPLRGDVIVGLGAGGMPTNRRNVPHARRYNAGQGNGCSFMLEQGVWADYALIAKPGWTAAWEEVGLCWFEVRVHGTYSYVGSRHRMAYRNPIVDAGTVIAGLEEWFPEYSARHTAGLVAPQGNIGGIEGGWRRTASLSPATCRFHVDLRISPRTTPMQAKREFAEAIDRIRAAHPGIRLDWEMTLAIPGTQTPEDNWIVTAAKAAWEDLEGRPHEPILNNSGATDANILRARGIPTARTGMDRIGDDAPMRLDFPAGMNVVDVREARKLVRALVHTIVDTCTRTREEVA
ncbi:M20 family metallopeptidase [Actinomadura rugatobispora]|uniref:M20 family metallopeptidase n=1 Tax=Actinomadura rugatobispora TaxID=1994 RepID=A0ABW1AI71_9ACTN|nr:M20/M25/M40 family metallo-hydrolase [Actinomadura rugatobispora]